LIVQKLHRVPYAASGPWKIEGCCHIMVQIGAFLNRVHFFDTLPLLSALIIHCPPGLTVLAWIMLKQEQSCTQERIHRDS
jgi:hypothetical protein